MDDMEEDLRSAVRVCILHGLQNGLRGLLDDLVRRCRCSAQGANEIDPDEQTRSAALHSRQLLTAAIDTCLQGMQLVIGQLCESQGKQLHDSMVLEAIVCELAHPDTSEERVETIVEHLSSLAGIEV